jgi:hypothetical protein
MKSTKGYFGLSLSSDNKQNDGNKNTKTSNEQCRNKTGEQGARPAMEVKKCTL